MTATEPDAWQELCLIGLIPESSSEIQLAGFTEDITALDWVEKPLSTIQLTNGGHLGKFDKNTKEGITLKMYPIKADDLSADGIVQLFHPQTTSDVTDPILVANTLKRKKFGLILLWATTLPATAGTQPAVGEIAYRVQVINAYMTKYKPSYDDKVLTAEVTFEWSPFAKDATANKREESCDSGGEQLPDGITTATSF